MFLFTCLFGLCSLFSTGQEGVKKPIDKVKSNEWVNLLDDNLSQWEPFTGVPENSVKNLPENYKKDVNGDNKAPIGLGDPMGIYKVVKDENGELVLNISGEVYAGLTSKKEFSNYHLTLLFKWGEKKYEPRLDRKRDSGVLYHCHGEHGAFWNVWKACLEYQVQEEDFGDLYVLGGTKATTTVDDKKQWDPMSKVKNNSHTKNALDAELPHGEWNRIDLYVLEDSAIHVTNGKVVLALTNAKKSDGEVLTSGQIQLQSESAECYMKDIHIRRISKFPKKLRRAAQL
ncbi:3-keto-disaccharide hydrolase [Cognatitamlana onchidii]|uniref:3-keto-disaccharide hydrolase n=1 Tax=Cognatitamlana onchidii TaxID=2562860 RepID=UPI00145615AE|nr:DUF1080 domain-containing protein [Algibacter onchidii]